MLIARNKISTISMVFLYTTRRATFYPHIIGTNGLAALITVRSGLAVTSTWRRIPQSFSFPLSLSSRVFPRLYTIIILRRINSNLSY